MNTYWRLLGFAKPIEKYAIPYFFYTLFYAAFNTFNFVLVMPILDTLFQQDTVEAVRQMPAFALNMDYFRGVINFLLYKTFGADYSKMDVLVFLGLFIITSSMLSNFFRYMGQRTIETMRIRTLEKLRNSVYDNVMGMHAGYFSNERKGDIISKISSDVQVVQFCITNTLQVAFRDPFLIIGYMVALVMISWKLTIFSALFLPLTALVIGSIVKRLRRSATEAQERFADMVSLMDESLSGIKILKSYNATGYTTDKFHRLNGLFSRISLGMARRQQLASPGQRVPRHFGGGRAAGLRRQPRAERPARRQRVYRLSGDVHADYASGCARSRTLSRISIRALRPASGCWRFWTSAARSPMRPARSR